MPSSSLAKPPSNTEFQSLSTETEAVSNLTLVINSEPTKSKRDPNIVGSIVPNINVLAPSPHHSQIGQDLKPSRGTVKPSFSITTFFPNLLEYLVSELAREGLLIQYPWPDESSE